MGIHVCAFVCVRWHVSLKSGVSTYNIVFVYLTLVYKRSLVNLPWTLFGSACVWKLLVDGS